MKCPKCQSENTVELWGYVEADFPEISCYPSFFRCLKCELEFRVDTNLMKLKVQKKK